MSRFWKAAYIIAAGIYALHPCNLSPEPPTDETAIYYLGNDEIEAIYSLTRTAQDRK